MTKKDWQRHMAYEALVILGVLALLLFVCRLWPILTLSALLLYTPRAPLHRHLHMDRSLPGH